MFSLNSIITSLVKNKPFQFIIDFFMLVVFAIMYFCVTLAYKNGEYRSFDFFTMVFSFSVYMLLIFKPTSKVINKICGKLNKMVKKISKKLKFGEKS